MTSAGDWTGHVGDVWAAEWRRTDRSLADLARHLDAAILEAVPPEGHVLDVGSGAGATSLALATARPDLTISGVDLSAELVAIAGERAVACAGIDRLRFLCGDALVAAAAMQPFDMIMSRHGLMFFADPVEALTCLRRMAGPGAPLVFSCFADRADNRFATIADAVTGVAPVDDPAFTPGPFAFADPDHVGQWLEQAGWRDLSSTRLAFDYVVGEGADPIEDALSFLSRIGAAARPIAAASPAMRELLLARLSSALEPYRSDNRIVLPASAWVWRAAAG